MHNEIDYLGLKLQSPILLSSGAMSNGFDRIDAAMKAGAGAVFTPSIRLVPMVQPERDIYAFPGGGAVLNAQGHSDIHWKVWAEEILPAAKAAGYPIIAKTGYTLEDVTELVPRLTQSGASAIEIIAPTSEGMARMVERAVSLTHLPVSAKMSGRWGDLEEIAQQCIAGGASAVTLMDTPGPALKLDCKTGESVLSGNTGHGWGFGWLSGPAIFPLTLAYVAKLRRVYPGLPLNAVGGVTTGASALQMILAGADTVSVQSAVITQGYEAITRIRAELDALIAAHWGTLEHARGAAQQYLEMREGHAAK